MSYCSKCGTQLPEGAKFCQKCGSPVAAAKAETERQQEYTGKIYKCPNCGEILKSFERNCPSCGMELRGAKATSAVREFALKLEAIESRREYEAPRGFFSNEATDRISKTDAQKISLIQSFTIPNTREDILEFMILATSNVNLRVYASLSTNSKSETALNDAWMTKIKQVYEKAKRSFGNNDDFQEIQELYDSCNREISSSKKRRIIKHLLILGTVFACFILLCLVGSISGNNEVKKETARLESIEKVAVEALENGEYKKALLNAEDLVFDPDMHEDELVRQWDIRRELLIDEIIEEAEKNGVHLERTEESDVSDVTDIPYSGSGFIHGIIQGASPGIKEGMEKFNESLEEVHRIKNEWANDDSTDTNTEKKGE